MSPESDLFMIYYLSYSELREVSRDNFTGSCLSTKPVYDFKVMQRGVKLDQPNVYSNPSSPEDRVKNSICSRCRNVVIGVGQRLILLDARKAPNPSPAG